MLYATNVAVEQAVFAPAIMIALLIFTRFWCTPPHRQSKASSDFSLRHRPEVGLQNLRSYKKWILSSSLATGW